MGLITILRELQSTLLPWSYVQAIRAHWVVWIVLFFSTGIKGMVNQIEQPFARSLVSCETPLDPDMYTGSRWCGDRYQVIQEGMYISGVGQGQEHFAMLCSLTFVIVLTGIWGAKVSLIMGLCGVTLSVFLFTIASSSPDLGRKLFAAGQGLQGMYPIEYLQGILMLHLGQLPGSDGQANFQVMTYMMVVGNILWNLILGNFVQVLELSNYRPIWFSVFILDVLIVLLVIVAFPPMKPFGEQRHEGRGPFMKVFLEVASYWELIYDWRARRYLVHKIFECLTYPWENVMTGGIFLAWHGWSQTATTWVFFWPQIISLLTFNIWQKIEKRFGNYTSFVVYVRCTFLLRAVCGVGMTCVTMPQAILSYVSCLFAGFGAKRGFVDNRFVEPEMMQRFQSVQWVLQYFMFMWVSPFYATLFDATAWTFADRMKPILWYLGALLGNYFAIFFGIWDIDGVEGCGVSLRVLDEGGKKGNILWGLVTAGDGILSAEKWYHVYDLENILEYPWVYTGAAEVGAMYDSDHFFGILSQINSSPKMGQEVLRRLDVAIERAKSVHRQYAEGLLRESMEHLGASLRGSPEAKPYEAEHERAAREATEQFVYQIQAWQHWQYEQHNKANEYLINPEVWKQPAPEEKKDA